MRKTLGTLIVWVVAAPCVVLVPRWALAQDDTAAPAAGFSVRKEAPAVTEAFDDFERYRDKKAWEKAFTAIGKVADARLDRLVPSQAGFFVPSRQKVREELISLPPDGREAYRLFNDAKAQKLFHDLVQADSDTSGGRDGQSPPADQRSTLQRLVDLYFVTSVGDQAADRLGDTLFEARDFAGAQSCWQLILDDYPDTAISPALLQTKRAIAMRSAGQSAQFQALREMIRSRYPGQTVHIGGQDIVASDLLDALASGSPGASDQERSVVSTLISRPSPDVALSLPNSDTPVWQYPLLDDSTWTQLQTQMNQFGWGGTTDQITKMVPDAAVDDRRLYVNWFGICFAIDLSTGKMVWRTGSFADLPQQLQQSLMQGQWSGADYSIATAGSRVLYAGRSTSQQNPQQPGSSLLCLNAETGKPVWKSESGSLADWSFTGRPLVRGEIAYVVARPSSTQELNLLTINLATGALQAKLILGTPTLGQTMRGTPLAPIPTLEEYRGTIYVLTNNGAVLAVDPAAGRVKWAFTYAAQVDTAQQVFYQPAPASSPIAPGAMLITDNTLLIKEYGGTTIYALDLAGPSLKWKRPIDDSVTIADADAHGLYLIGTEADCIDPVSRDMQWSTELSIDTGFIRPLVSGGHLYVFGQRGVHQVDSASGDTGPIFRGFDHDGTGGALWRTPGRLITISNRAITAYPLGSDATH